MLPHRRSFPAWLASPRLQVATIVLVAAFFRLWQIEGVPPGLFGDEAAEGLDALDVLAGRGQVFFPSNYGREGLYIWFVALSLKLFGVTPLAVRLPAVIVGTLTCVVAWWLARELTAHHGPRSAGLTSFVQLPASSSLLPAFLPLITGLYLATAYWHVHFSRFSQRTILTPFFVGLAAAAFWRGVNLGRTRWFVAAGAGMGLALHAYSVGRFFPVFLALFLAIQWLVTPGPRPGEPEHRLLARFGRAIAWMCLAAAVVFAPLGYYFVTHPGSFMQRASVVATYSDGDMAASLGLIGRAALANLAQYVLPDAGDRAQFHNLPGRPVFEPLTALLALLGLLVAVRRWRAPVPLFLLLWLAVLTAPAALATDRFPTLPRVLGVIPGLYLFPAIGLGAIMALLARWANRARSKRPGDVQGLAVRCRAVAPLLLTVLALLVPAGVTYRDYFQAWGPSAATFDAFEGDMAAAWHWVTTQAPDEHVYLSSDIYRHPTFMLLAEKVTVTEYFTHANPRLSWFDARSALPLPPAGQPATYLIGSSAPLSGPPAALLVGQASARDQVVGPGGQPALTVLELPAGHALWLPLAASGPEVAFSKQLTLLAARWAPASGDGPLLVLTWRTSRPDPSGWGGYRLEAALGEQMASSAFDAYRSPEWTPGGLFVTWHRLDLPDRNGELSLRLVRGQDDQPLGQPAALDGWQRISVGP